MYTYIYLWMIGAMFAASSFDTHPETARRPHESPIDDLLRKLGKDMRRSFVTVQTGISSEARADCVAVSSEKRYTSTYTGRYKMHGQPVRHPALALRLLQSLLLLV